MAKLYTTIPAPKVQRNIFNLSHPNSFSMVFQKCVPTMVTEIIPGDKFVVGSELFARLQPMVAPVMNNMKISQHAFFVPLRTLNKHFSEFMFNNRTGDYSEVLPYTNLAALATIVGTLYNSGSGTTADIELAANVIRLYDYIGLPFAYSSATDASTFVSQWVSLNSSITNSSIRVNLAPFFAYTKVWSEYFRDENLVDDPFEEFEDNYSMDVKDWTGDCTSLIANQRKAFAKCFLQLRPRAWAHDRFTSSLPFAQRGPDVLLPVAGTAPVKYKDGFLLEQGELQQGLIKSLQPGQSPSEATVVMNYGTGSGSTSRYTLGGPVGSYPQGVQPAAYDPNGSLEADFSEAALTTTINDFRRAERLQRWYENSARGGIRPNEATLAHFGVHTPDATLDRSEFLGGTMQPLVVSEVAQTSETGTTPQGNLAGKGTSYKGNLLFKRFFSEHGFVFVFTSALCRANYWQGLPKIFSRMQRDEYYWPEFALLGEEPVFNKEIYIDNNTTEDSVFGYVPRYSDYKSAQGETHGDFRSSMDMWTQNREFSNQPQLNEEFVYAAPSLSPFAVQSNFNDVILCTVNYDVKASRLMPYYGVPTI